jgi:hypothetical protein
MNRVRLRRELALILVHVCRQINRPIIANPISSEYTQISRLKTQAINHVKRWPRLEDIPNTVVPLAGTFRLHEIMQRILQFDGLHKNSPIRRSSQTRKEKRTGRLAFWEKS